MRYFVSGHRDLTQEEFDRHYVYLLDRVLADDPCAEFIVGDWEGCDTLFVNYIKTYKDIKVNICYKDDGSINPQPRIFKQNHGVDIILPTYDECDSYMTFDSDFDIAWIRPGREDSHTAKNIKRRYNL